MMKRVVILVTLVLALCLGTAAAEGSMELGQPFTDFTATDSQGNTFTLSEVLKDHEAALINIWATWCSPCEAEMPFLNEAYEQYGDRVAFIALTYDDEDTNEKIEAYRLSHGISFPMGRDEDAALYMYLGGEAIPTTAVVDRFGNTVFLQTGSFFRAGDVLRVIGAFLGDGYTETAVLNDIPKDVSTCAVPASATTGIYAENEDARPVLFRPEGEPEPTRGYVISGDTARLRLEAAASDNPADLLCYDYRTGTMTELAQLADPERGAYVCDIPMPAADEETHYTYVIIVNGEGRILDGVYLIPGEEYVEGVAEEMRSWGYAVTWEYAEQAPAEESALQVYVLHIIDQDGNPVPGMMVNFCTDTACTMKQSDGNGTISFDGVPDVYHVQLLKAPEGYSFDTGFDMYTGSTYGEWAIRVRKDQ